MPNTRRRRAPNRNIAQNSPPTSSSGLAMPNTRRGRAPDRNIAQEFENYFGNETNLANWQNLCEDVGIKDDLNSIRKCKLALNGVWVNIHDLLDAVNNNSKPRIFKTERALAAYTMSTGKIYPKKEAKKGGPVRALLAHIFH